MDTTSPVPSQAQTSGFDGPGKLLKFAWNILTKHWKTVGLVVWLPYAASAIVQLLFSGTLFSGSTFTLGISAIILVIVSIVVWVFSLASIPASIQAIHRVTTDPGTPITIKSQYRFGFSVFWSLFLLIILQGLVTVGGYVLLVIPGIMVTVYCAFYLYTLVIEGKKGFSALIESFLLVRGRWWPVFGRFILFGLVCLGIWLVFVLIQYLLALIFGYSMMSPKPEFGMIVIQTIIGLIASAIFYPLSFGFGYAMYSSLRKTYVADTSANTSAFKGWLVAFLVFGILGPIVMIIISFTLVALSTRSNILNMPSGYQQNMMQLQQQMNQQNLDMMKSGTNIPVQQ